MDEVRGSERLTSGLKREASHHTLPFGEELPPIPVAPATKRGPAQHPRLVNVG